MLNSDVSLVGMHSADEVIEEDGHVWGLKTDLICSICGYEHTIYKDFSQDGYADYWKGLDKFLKHDCGKEATSL